MIVKFDISGTHLHKGFLKVRVDLYPEVEDKTYELHYIQVPVIPDEGYLGEVDKEGLPRDMGDYTVWVESLPKVWQLNPCLCHFIKIDMNTTLLELTDYVRGILDKNTILELDDLLSKVSIDHTRITQIMKTRCGTGDKVSFVPIDLNYRLSLLEVKV